MAEIVVLRNELTATRRKLDAEAIETHKTKETLEQQKVLLARARSALAAILNREDR
jgi:hypothetical protein